MQLYNLGLLQSQDLTSIQRFNLKRDVMIEWLLESRHSALDIGSAFLGVKSKDTRVFLNSLIEAGVLVQFKNHMMQKRDLVRLGTAGLAFWGDKSIPRTNTKSKDFSDKASLPHDLGVQKCILDVLANFENPGEVLLIYDRENPYFSLVQPDALVFFWDEELPTAIEYERRGKSDLKQFYLFQRYRRLIMESQVYERVLFYFHDEAEMNEYWRNFQKTEWPIVQKSGEKFTIGKRKMGAPADADFRQWFGFRLMPLDSKPILVKSINPVPRQLTKQSESWLARGNREVDHEDNDEDE
jgi:hypothetical protein